MMKVINLSFLLLWTHVLAAQTDTILVDFGSSSSLSAAPWNNVTNAVNGQIPNLRNNWGSLTGIGLAVFDAFNSVNSNGTLTPAPALGIPSTASSDAFFGNMTDFGGQTQPSGGMLISGLDTGKSYTVSLFASRIASDNRQTRYVLRGLSSDTLYLDVSNNISQLAVASLFPDTSGNISINATAGPANNNSYGFFYVGALKLSYASDTLPSYLNLLSPQGGEYWQVGRIAAISWESHKVGDILLEYSSNAGLSWSVIDTLKGYQQPYQWTVPASPSTSCLVRISSGILSEQSDGFFEISNDTTQCPIVILGSSTAAGAGASIGDSAWVNRFRNVLMRQNTRFSVHNLAAGGYTTYHILPNGTAIPPNVSITVDTARNFTKALIYRPFAIIVNMPSNDAAMNFTAQQQLGNYRILWQQAQAHGISMFICTPQPRNFGSIAQRQLQMEVRDSLLQEYGNYVIDFWTGIADSAGFILPIYNSGDGVHLNDRGHGELSSRVLQHRIDTSGCGVYSSLAYAPDFPIKIRAFPNPFTSALHLVLESEKCGDLRIELFDLQGRLIGSRAETIAQVGPTEFDLGSWTAQTRSGLFLLRISLRDQAGMVSEYSLRLLREQE